MKYNNLEIGFSIDVPDEYKCVPKSKYAQLGIKEPSMAQILYIFTKLKDDLPEFSFNITRDAIYKDDNDAMTTGMALNEELLVKSGANILAKESITLPSGRKAIKMLLDFKGVIMTDIFTSIKSVLICFGYANLGNYKDNQKTILDVLDSISE